MDIKALLERIRPLAEDFVQRNIPSEFPYFSLVWEHIGNAVPDMPEVAPEDKAAWARSVLPEGLGFANGQTYTPQASLVILAVLAVAVSSGQSLPIPSEEKMSDALFQCAIALGLPKDTATTLSRELRANLLHIIQGTQAAIPSAIAAKSAPYILWFSRKEAHGSLPVPLMESDLKKHLKPSDQDNLYIYLNKVYVCTDSGAPVICSIPESLKPMLFLFLKYKDKDLTATEIHARASYTDIPLSSSQRTSEAVVDDQKLTLRYRVSRLKKKIGLDKEIFDFKSVRLGYRCQGDFAFKMVLDADTDRRLYIPRFH